MKPSACLGRILAALVNCKRNKHDSCCRSEKIANLALGMIQVAAAVKRRVADQQNAFHGRRPPMTAVNSARSTAPRSVPFPGATVRRRLRPATPSLSELYPAPALQRDRTSHPPDLRHG